MTAFAWIGFGILAAGVVLIVLGLFVEERALQIPRLYDDDSLR